MPRRPSSFNGIFRDRAREHDEPHVEERDRWSQRHESSYDSADIFEEAQEIQEIIQPIHKEVDAEIELEIEEEPAPRVALASAASGPPRIVTAMGLGPAGFAPVSSAASAASAGGGAHTRPPAVQVMHPMMAPAQTAPMQAQFAQGQSAQAHGAAAYALAPQVGSMVPQTGPAFPAFPALGANPYVPGPVLTPGLSPSLTRSQESRFQRAPWFCLGLMFGVAAMVMAFFLPAREAAPSIQAAPIGQTQAAQAQAAQTPGARSPSVAPPQLVTPPGNAPAAAAAPVTPGTPGTPAAASTSSQSSGTSQASVPPPIALSTGPSTGAPAAITAPASKPVPTVDVRTLPVAGQRTTGSPRRAGGRGPQRRAAAAPKPQPQPQSPANDDDAKPAPSSPESVSGDLLLQAL